MQLSTQDSWLIIGPGRTGSKVIVDIIRGVYFKKCYPIKYFDPSSDLNRALVDIPINKIVHSHTVEFFDAFKKKRTHVVLSKRNMIESSLSWVIQREIGYWHIYDSTTLESINISPIKFDYDFFMQIHTSVTSFYQSIKSRLDESVIVIDYDDLKNNPYYVVANKLGINEYIVDCNFILPIKNPGLPKNWFIDWDNIYEKISKLESIPPI
jgi:hypothetical protein